MKKVLLYLWQLSQNILGLLVILITKAHHTVLNWEWIASEWPYFGVSLGNYIIFGGAGGSLDSLKHELGHQKQSKYLGPLYLVICLLSLLGNIIVKIWWVLSPKDKQTAGKIVKLYYHLPWEYWADKLGGVRRNYEE